MSSNKTGSPSVLSRCFPPDKGGARRALSGPLVTLDPFASIRQSETYRAAQTVSSSFGVLENEPEYCEERGTENRYRYMEVNEARRKLLLDGFCAVSRLIRKCRSISSYCEKFAKFTTFTYEKNIIPRKVQRPFTYWIYSKWESKRSQKSLKAPCIYNSV